MDADERIYTTEDFNFMPEEEREHAAYLLNKGAFAATHSTVNTGPIHLPEPDDIIVTDVVNLLCGA